jgi:hypothetical protein
VSKTDFLVDAEDAYICVYWYIWEKTRTLNTERYHTFILIHIYIHTLKQRIKNLLAAHTRWLSPIYTYINIHAGVFSW